MEFTAKQIAQVVNGEIVGDENAAVRSFARPVVVSSIV